METQVIQPGSTATDLLMGKGSSKRAFKDKLTQIGVTMGGTMVFVALLLIFFYLLYVVKPIFDGADVTPVINVELQDAKSPALMVGSDEQNEILYRVSQDGGVSFYSALSASLVKQEQINVPQDAEIVSSVAGVPSEQRFAFGLSNGQVIIGGVNFAVTYPNNKRLITPSLRYPLGASPLQVSESGTPLYQLAFASASDKLSFAYHDANGRWFLTRHNGEENMMTEEVEWEATTSQIQEAPAQVDQQLMTPDQRQLLLRSGNRLYVYDIRYVDEIGRAHV